MFSNDPKSLVMPDQVVEMVVKLRLKALSEARAQFDELADDALSTREIRDNFVSVLKVQLLTLRDTLADDHPQIIAHPQMIAAYDDFELHVRKTLEYMKQHPTSEKAYRNLEDLVSALFRHDRTSSTSPSKKGFNG